MGEKLTYKQKQNLELLKRLCLFWSKFTEIKWQGVNIFIDGKDVNILYYQLFYLDYPDGTKKKHCNQSFKYFPLSELSKQIKEYKAKIKKEWKLTH